MIEGLNTFALLCMQASADSDSRNLATLLLLRDLQSKRMGSEAALRKTDDSDGPIRPSELLPDQALALKALCSEAALLQHDVVKHFLAFIHMLALTREAVLSPPSAGLHVTQR